MKQLIFYLLSASISSTFFTTTHGFQSLSRTALVRDSSLHRLQLKSNIDTNDDDLQQPISPSSTTISRRNVMERTTSSILATILPPVLLNSPANAAGPAEAINYSPEFVQTYSDFTKSEEGWQYKDVKVGSGDSPRTGDRVVFDWSGYTIGYFGRPFEAKGGPQGGAFDKDKDYIRTTLGSNKMVTALESNFLTMKPGGVRQVIVPYGPLSYPTTDLEHVVVGPKPTTFSGQRALNFVLENSRVDRTLLFNVKLIRVDKSDGKGGYDRGERS